MQSVVPEMEESGAQLLLVLGLGMGTGCDWGKNGAVEKGPKPSWFLRLSGWASLYFCYKWPSTKRDVEHSHSLVLLGVSKSHVYLHDFLTFVSFLRRC